MKVIKPLIIIGFGSLLWIAVFGVLTSFAWMTTVVATVFAVFICATGVLFLSVLLDVIQAIYVKYKFHKLLELDHVNIGHKNKEKDNVK